MTSGGGGKDSWRMEEKFEREADRARDRARDVGNRVYRAGLEREGSITNDLREKSLGGLREKIAEVQKVLSALSVSDSVASVKRGSPEKFLTAKLSLNGEAGSSYTDIKYLLGSYGIRSIAKRGAPVIFPNPIELIRLADDLEIELRGDIALRRSDIERQHKDSQNMSR